MKVEELLAVIKMLPEDEPTNNPTVWYRSQREHWIGWLSDYYGPGAYGRKSPPPKEARRVYNRIVCPQMLQWLLAQASGRIRKLFPWDYVQTILEAYASSNPVGRRADEVRQKLAARGVTDGDVLRAVRWARTQ